MFKLSIAGMQRRGRKKTDNARNLLMYLCVVLWRALWDEVGQSRCICKVHMAERTMREIVG